MVSFGGSIEPAYTWEHYVACPDQLDRDGRVFNNKAERLVGEFWVSLLRTTTLCTSLLEGIRALMTRYAMSYMQDFYRCNPGYESKAATLAHTACAKLVKDVHYETRVQAVILYYTDVLKVKSQNMRQET